VAGLREFYFPHFGNTGRCKPFAEWLMVWASADFVKEIFVHIKNKKLDSFCAKSPRILDDHKTIALPDNL
jgi:hypothetical protein